MKKLLHLWPLWLVTFLFASFMALTAFVNSSMVIDLFGVSETVLGIVYSLGSLCALIGILVLPRVFQYNISVKKVLATIIVMGSVSTAGLVLFPLAAASGITLFILYLVATSAILYVLDIVVSHYSTPSNTGIMRGWYLTIISIAWVIAPLVSGYLIDIFESYTLVYILASIFMAITAGVVAITYDSFIPQTSVATHRGLYSDIHAFMLNKNLRNIFITNTLLQIFYAVMVIYSPIYLNEVIGLSWEHIGIIFAIMLMAFVLFDYPLGYIADTYIGEKEILTMGLILMSGTTLLIAFVGNVHWAWWALLFFGTRTGAAATEMMNESFFFKHVTSDDVSYIGFYRNARPVAYIVAPLVMSFFLWAFDLQTHHIFMILSVLIVLGVFWSLGIEDTK